MFITLDEMIESRVMPLVNYYEAKDIAREALENATAAPEIEKQNMEPGQEKKSSDTTAAATTTQVDDQITVVSKLHGGTKGPDSTVYCTDEKSTQNHVGAIVRHCLFERYRRGCKRIETVYHFADGCVLKVDITQVASPKTPAPESVNEKEKEKKETS